MPARLGATQGLADTRSQLATGSKVAHAAGTCLSQRAAEIGIAPSGTCAGSTQGDTPSASQVGRQIKCAVREVHKLSAQHAKATQAGKKGKAWHLRARLLKSYNARLVAVWEANKRLPKHKRVPLTDLPRRAEQLDAWTPIDEEVFVQPKAKRSGGWRPIFSFGLRNKARDILVLRALEPTGRLTEHQFAGRGQGGREAATRAVSEAMRDGYTWAVEMDIKDCYRSFDNEMVAKVLPLPREVAMNITSIARLNLIPRKSTHLTLGPLDLLGQSQWGLPQGSALSPWIAERVIGYVLRSLSSESVR
jgi:hypothetical protein